MTDLLREVFSAKGLRELADPMSLARGASYFLDGRVELGTVGPDAVQATVRGTMPYRVELRAAGGRPTWWCNCPVGAEGRFCKHAVAVAMAVNPETAETGPRPRPAPGPDPGLRDYLVALGTDPLVDLLLEQAAVDPRLRDRLTARAAAAAGAGIDEGALRWATTGGCWQSRVTPLLSSSGP